MESIFTTANLQAIWLSLQVAFYTSVFILPIAIGVGYLLARKEFRGKVLLETFLHLPMVMPPVTTGYLLLLLLGTKGWVGQWLYAWFGWRIAFTFGAAVVAAMVVSFPLIIRSVKVAMEMVDPRLEQASQSLGASPFQTFLHVSLPLAWPGILAGFVLSFARSLGEFGATITFAGNIEGQTRTLPLAIYSKMQVPGQENETMWLVVISVGIAFAAIIISEYFYSRRKKNLAAN